MAKGYHHLTRDQRCQIYALKAIKFKGGIPQAEIAREVGVSASTVSRELKRNGGKKGYRYVQAQNWTKERRSKASQQIKKFTEPVKQAVEDALKSGWSPEQIEGRFKLENKPCVSHEWIYQHLWADKKAGGKLYLNLRHCRKKYQKRGAKTAGRGCIPHRIDITERPQEANDKSQVGHLEGDLIIGAQHQGALLTQVDRYSKFAFISKVPNKTAQAICTATQEKLAPFLAHLHTITYDNGKEFAWHQTITATTGLRCFFATPYHSWERGLNEHTNGLIRQYFPKSMNLSVLSEQEIQAVEDALNDRPRKVLHYQTPREVFLQATHPPPNVALQT